uniref:Uncharacterized protein n=1 Tax=Glossina austeni TaxID=7395 RepID=A0A1A9VJB4_GLOAU
MDAINCVYYYMAHNWSDDALMFGKVVVVVDHRQTCLLGAFAILSCGIITSAMLGDNNGNKSNSNSSNKSSIRNTNTQSGFCEEKRNISLVKILMFTLKNKSIKRMKLNS